MYVLDPSVGSRVVEWAFNGIFVDRAPHRMRGVSIFGPTVVFHTWAPVGVEQERFAWVRFYLEPVQRDGAAADKAVQHVMQQARS
jgi:hypothetical protein